jgi:hypothetical protein
MTQRSSGLNGGHPGLLLSNCKEINIEIEDDTPKVRVDQNMFDNLNVYLFTGR